jgi:hypothetical protein
MHTKSVRNVDASYSSFPACFCINPLIISRTRPDGASRLICIEFLIIVIVGLNIATKGALPFSRGKQSVLHHTKISMRLQILELYHVTK